jgi:hypothetical protein
MKKLIAVAVLALFAGGCSCTLEKKALNEVEATHGIVLPQYLSYVEKDAALNAAQKDDRRKLVESLKRVTGELRKQAE